MLEELNNSIQRAVDPFQRAQVWPVPFIYDDGGRSASKFRAQTVGDCFVRSVAIVMQRGYQEVYDEVFDFIRSLEIPRRGRRLSSPRNGIMRDTAKRYLLKKGFLWKSMMGIGTGCTCHLRIGEVPAHGRHILSLSRHFAALVEGQLRDTHDCSRNGTRCVYGYFTYELT